MNFLIHWCTTKTYLESSKKDRRSLRKRKKNKKSKRGDKKKERGSSKFKTRFFHRLDRRKRRKKPREKCSRWILISTSRPKIITINSRVTISSMTSTISMCNSCRMTWKTPLRRVNMKCLLPPNRLRAQWHHQSSQRIETTRSATSLLKMEALIPILPHQRLKKKRTWLTCTPVTSTSSRLTWESNMGSNSSERVSQSSINTRSWYTQRRERKN